jgi:hypothetical protein
MSSQPTKQTTPRAPVVFEPNEVYERMLELRESNPAKYELENSIAAKHAAEHYERARAKAQRSA